MANPYSDSWVNINNYKGEIIGATGSWYTCLAKTGDWANTHAEGKHVWAPQSCLKLYPSKYWRLARQIQ